VNGGRWWHSPTGRAALATVGFAVALVVWTLSGALRGAPMPAAPASTFANADGLASARATPTRDVNDAVERDPFAPDRAAPAQRYRAPGEEPDAPAEAPIVPVVLGTAVADAARSFATVQLGGGNPVILHVGDKIAAYTVSAIARGRVTFRTSSGSPLQVSESKP